MHVKVFSSLCWQTHTQEQITQVAFLCIGGCVSIALQVLLCVKRLYVRLSMVLSLAVWFVCIVTVNCYYSVARFRSPPDALFITLYLVAVLHMMLPLPQRYSILLGGVTTVLELTLSAALSKTRREYLALQVRWYRDISPFLSCTTREVLFLIKHSGKTILNVTLYLIPVR